MALVLVIHRAILHLSGATKLIKEWVIPTDAEFSKDSSVTIVDY